MCLPLAHVQVMSNQEILDLKQKLKPSGTYLFGVNLAIALGVDDLEALVKVE